MADAADRTALEIEREEERREQERKNKLMDEVPNKITQCVECGCKIPAARKKMFPHTTLCVECKDFQERRLR